ncbi:general substrate transporter [Macroventuria anomochaeta]|uniref:General substrate transporter n=1 Tax=Macroventuria anomochaeta TaxID=301207 RepID=A0ACB6RT86_9PLEO|nr:general substrate transporter [Macroventuria anomochaeta]KAF2624979.1 general substrate transporter [Macroventuria anomochaeta]
MSGFLLLSFDQGVMGGIVGADNPFGRHFNNPDADMQGNITALYDIGCVLGSIITYFVGKRFGRHTMLMAGGAIMIVGAALLGSSTTIAQLITGRIVTGVGNSMDSSTAPVYLTECAPPSYRGALLTLQGTATILGVVIAYWMDYGTNVSSNSFKWRFPLSFQAVFAVFLILQIIDLPETPRWLVVHDRYAEAKEATAALEGKPLDDPTDNATILDIKSGLDEEHNDGLFRFMELFSWGGTQNVRRLLIVISIQLGQQFSGSNMINYYLPVILQDSMGLSHQLSLILGGAAQRTFLVGLAIRVLLMDRFGLCTLFMGCSAGLCLCFVCVSALLSKTVDGMVSEGRGYAATAFIFMFQLFYGVGWLPVPCFYPPEIATTRKRTKVQAIASGWNWMLVFVVVKTTLIACGNIQWHTFIVFAFLNAASITTVYFFYPETKGLTLEDIPLLFHKKGITGGVSSSKGGRTVFLEQHARKAHIDKKMHLGEERMEGDQAQDEKTA